jgi:hypothetical protein
MAAIKAAIFISSLVAASQAESLLSLGCKLKTQTSFRPVFY